MQPFREIPIKQKLMAIIMFVTSSALVLSGLGIVIADSVLFRSAMQRDISALAQIVADNPTAALAFDDPKTASETLASLRARPHLVSACIYRPDGTLFAAYTNTRGATMCAANSPPNQDDQLRFTGAGLMIRRPIALNNRRLGTLVLLYDLGEISE